MLTIIELSPRADGGHGLQSQSHRTQCWLGGWGAGAPAALPEWPPRSQRPSTKGRCSSFYIPGPGECGNCKGR